MIDFQTYLKEATNIESKLNSAIKMKEGHISVKNYILGMYNFKNNKFKVDIWDDEDTSYWADFNVKKPNFTSQLLTVDEFKNLLIDICKDIKTLNLGDQTQ